MSDCCITLAPAGPVCFDDGTNPPQTLLMHAIYSNGEGKGQIYTLYNDVETVVDVSVAGATLTEGFCPIPCPVLASQGTLTSWGDLGATGGGDPMRTEGAATDTKAEG